MNEVRKGGLRVSIIPAISAVAGIVLFRADGEDGSFAPAKGGENIEQQLPGIVFVVDRVHPLRGRVALQNLRSRIGPFANIPAADVAGCDAHTRIIANAFHFAGIADRVDVEKRLGRVQVSSRKPDGRAHRFATFSKCFKAQIALSCELCERHRWAHGLARGKIPRQMRAETSTDYLNGAGGQS